MQKLKDKLRSLGITYRDLAKRAGTKTQNVQCYLSQARDLGPGPEWVEDAIRGVLVDAGVHVLEANELIADWKAARIRLNRGTDMADKEQTVEEQIANTIKSAWALSTDVKADVAALKDGLRRGLGADEETRRRAIQKRLDDEMANEAIGELTAQLWAEREQALRDRLAQLQHELQETIEQAAALEAAIAGRGDKKLLEECQRLGVNPQDRLNALRRDGGEGPMREITKAREALEKIVEQPLHPGPRPCSALPVRMIFARNSVEQAALWLAKPWLCAEELPELALHIFRLRHVLAPIPDMEARLREDFRVAGPVKDFWYVATWERRHPKATVFNPCILWAGRYDDRTSLPSMNTPPGQVLFWGEDEIPVPRGRGG